MASQILINIGSGNGLLPDGTKSLFGPTLTYRKWGLLVFTQGQFHGKYTQYTDHGNVWKIQFYKLQPQVFENDIFENAATSQPMSYQWWQRDDLITGLQTIINSYKENFSLLYTLIQRISLLTHWGLNKYLADKIFKFNFLNENYYNLIQISLKFNYDNDH